MARQQASYKEAFEKHFMTVQEDEHGVEGKPRMLPIVEFSKRWCGITPNLWQRVMLKLYAGEKLSTEVAPPYDVSEDEWLELQHRRGNFPPDLYRRIRERGSLGFENISLVIGRRGGKTTIIAVAALYTVYKLLQYPNPQKHYGITESEPILVGVAANAGEQARDKPFGKIVAICQEAIHYRRPLARWIDNQGIMTEQVFFKTDHDREIAKSPKLKGKRIASVQIQSYHTNQTTLRGGSIIAAIFDEFAHFEITQNEDKGDTFYQVLSASLHQFGADARAFTLSSPNYQYGKFYDMYVQAWNGKMPRTLSVRMSSWDAWEFEPNPVVTKKGLADDDRVKFTWDYEKGETWEQALDRASSLFKKEYGALFEGAEEQWLAPALIDNKLWDHSLVHRVQGEMGRFYAGWGDVGWADDAFSIAVVHREGQNIIVDHLWRFFVAPDWDYVPQDYETVVFQEGVMPANIDSSDVLEYMKHDILNKFNMYSFGFDQKESQLFKSQLGMFIMQTGKNTMINVVPFTPQFNKDRADNFKMLLSEDRLKCYNHPLLRWELLGLQKDRQGRVRKGPYSKDDLYDALSAACLSAMNIPEGVDFGDQVGFYNLSPVIAPIRM